MEQKPSRLIVLFGLCAAALIPLMLFRDPTVSNELRYLSIADEALRDGHIFAFYNHGVAYADKPPLYLWLIIAGRLLFGCHSMLWLSLLSLVPAFITVAVLDRWCAPVMSRSHRIAAAAALISTLYFTACSVVVRMDMLMIMFITLALYTFFRMYEGDGRLRLRIAFPLYVFLAVFSKGAVGILVPLLCIPAFLLLKKQLRTLGRYWGWMTWGILLLLCGAWFFMAYREGGADYLRNLLFHQTVDRAVNAFWHKAPFYFYLLHFWYILFPWCLLAAGTIAIALFRRQDMDDRSRFMSCSSIVIIVMLSLISSKLDIYLLPAIGLIVYATFLLLPALKADKFVKYSLLVPLVCLAAALPVAAIILRKPDSGAGFASLLSPWTMLPLEIGTVAALAALFRGKLKLLTCAFAAGMYLTLFVSGLQIKQLNPYIGYRALCEEAVETAAAEGITRFVLATDADGVPLLDRGENIDVYLGTAVEMLPLSVIEELACSPDTAEKIIVFTETDKKPTFAVYGQQ